MLFEYAVEPKAIGSSWQNFRYWIEKFGFDRGRLISEFPKTWLREVHTAAARMKDIERARVTESLALAKRSKLVRYRRPYVPTLGGWLENAIVQHAASPFHAIIAENNPDALSFVLLADEMYELHPLMMSARTWEVERVGPSLAHAMEPLLRSARTVLFVDRFFDISEERYRDTLRACLQILHANGGTAVRCEIHYCDHDERPSVDFVEQNAPRWLRGVIPAGMCVTLFSWSEKDGGEDFHARYLLTDVGGISIDAGFSAEGIHQRVPLGLLDSGFCESKLLAFDRSSTIYDLVEPVLQIDSDGTVLRIQFPHAITQNGC